jgi:virulence-associated protein VagC
MPMKAQLIEAEDGEQMVVFPAGFEIDADEVELTQDHDRVIVSPIRADTVTDRES